MATPRPAVIAARSRRPSSAIFLGSPATLPDLPDLPSSPASSGLPSPPETAVEIGSGDEGRPSKRSSVYSTASSSSASSASLSTLHGAKGRRIAKSLRNAASAEIHEGDMNKSRSRSGSRSRSRSPSSFSDDAADANDNDEDHTAKLSDDRRLLSSTSRSNANDSETSSALQRVKSLTQNRRSVLSKLSSISSGSRLSTPSPLARLSRSPTPSNASRLSKDSKLATRSLSRASGSETERDRTLDAHSSSEDLSETPTSTTSSHFRSQSVRERRATVSDNERIRIPLADSISATQRRTESRQSGDIEAAALAAVANSRRITPPEARRRQPLPREFRLSKLDGNSLPEPPRTPRRDRASPGLYSNHGSPSSHVATLHDSPNSPRAKPRYSTVREITRKHQTRWLSQDLTSPPRGLPDEDGIPQRRRGGSGESPLIPNGRSVIGESLRAAGIRRREDGEDIFGESDASRRLRLTSDLGTRPSFLRPESRAENDRPMSASGYPPQEFRTPPNAILEPRTARTVHVDRIDRPSTSLATYHDEPRTAPPLLRTYKSNYVIPDNERLIRELNAESISRPLSRARVGYAISSVANEGRSASVLGRRPLSAQFNNNNNTSESAGTETTPEHARLMLDSLNLFEQQLQRLPPMGSTTTVTIPELFRSAQNIVHATQALNNLLRGGTAHALEQQIDAELNEEGQTVDLVGLWRDVGSEFRESMRVSDELVRTMTSFLLGAGKVLREAVADKPHTRTISLDETGTRRMTPDPAFSSGRQSEGPLSSDGGSSRLDGRRRWENSSGEMGGTMTSFTSQHSSHPSAPSATSSRSSKALENASSAGGGIKAPDSSSEPAATARKLARLSLTSSRRHDSLINLRDSLARESASLREGDISASTIQVDSPLAAATSRRFNDAPPRRSNTVSAAPTLPTLPSESLITRRATVKATTISRRPKTSSGSGAGVTSAIFPALSVSGEPTTAVSTTSAQASPERPRASGGNGNSGSGAKGSGARTFSRASVAAIAGLQLQMDRDRENTAAAAAASRRRTTSASSAMESEVARKVRRAVGYESERGPEGVSAGAARARVGRASLDSNREWEREQEGGARERRTTMTGIFSRA